MISGKASRYQIGEVRYIGGQTKTLRAGLEAQTVLILEKKSVKTLSILDEVEEP
jgi:hypothetical protein